jgi:RNA polymerase sigma factor (TIGR02999 family)
MAGGGKRDAMERLLALVYGELRELARRQRFRWRDPRALGTTSLLHEAYLKLVDQTQVDWQSRGQFFYLASLAMRNVLVDNARRHQRLKRGGGLRAVPVDEAALVSRERGAELLALDEALDRLAGQDAQLARIVECRFFGGLTVEETAAALSISPATVKRGWSAARLLLYRELKDSPPDDPPDEGDGSP